MTNTTPTIGAADLPEARLFTKKPVTISATQWFKNGDHPQVRAIAPSDDLFFTGMGGAMLTGREKYGVIGTLESPNHLVTPGDWIITGVAGEHYACKPDIFEATYSPAALAAGQATAAKQAPECPSMPETWHVVANVLGEPILSIGYNWLSGKGELTEAETQAVIGMAKHMLAFVGYGLPPSSFDPDADEATAAQPVAEPVHTKDALIATMLDALTHARKALNHNNLALECGPVNSAILAARASHGQAPSVEREQERIAFKDAHRHLELYEVPDAWGRPMFKHSHVEASWLGWIARASRGQAPAGVTLRSMIEGMSVSVDVSTGDHDAGRRYFGAVTEVMECQGNKHGVTLLVQDAEPNFTATPTAPSTPSSTAQQASAHVLILAQDAFAEVAMAYPKAFALHKVGLADTAVRKALAAYTPQAADTGAAQGASITAGMEPAATVRTLGVIGVKFSGWTDYGCSLPDGTKLYTEAQLQAQIAAAPQPSPTAQAASVQEDAMRYRWLRRWKGQEHEPPFTVQHEIDGTLWGGDLDAAIDAAMNKGATNDR